MFLAGRSAVFTLITPGEHNWRLTSCEVGTCAPMLLARVQAKKTRPAESANGVFLEIVATATSRVHCCGQVMGRSVGQAANRSYIQLDSTGGRVTSIGDSSGKDVARAARPTLRQ